MHMRRRQLQIQPEKTLLYQVTEKQQVVLKLWVQVFERLSHFDNYLDLHNCVLEKFSVY